MMHACPMKTLMQLRPLRCQTWQRSKVTIHGLREELNKGVNKGVDKRRRQAEKEKGKGQPGPRRRRARRGTPTR